ncbi:MAG: hypothetical protein ACLSWD_00235 [Clostridium sp.]
MRPPCVRERGILSLSRLQKHSFFRFLRHWGINDGLSFILRQEKEAFWLDHELKLSASAKPSHLLFIMNIDSIQNLMARLEVAI